MKGFDKHIHASSVQNTGAEAGPSSAREPAGEAGTQEVEFQSESDM